MYIDDAVSVHLESLGTELLHITCKNHEIDTVGTERFSDCTVKGAWSRMRPSAEVYRWNARPPGTGKCAGSAIVADYDAHARRETSRSAPVEYRLQVGSASRGKHPQAIDGIRSRLVRSSTLRHGGSVRWLTLLQIIRRGRCTNAGNHRSGGNDCGTRGQVTRPRPK